MLSTIFKYYNREVVDNRHKNIKTVYTDQMISSHIEFSRKKLLSISICIPICTSYPLLRNYTLAKQNNQNKRRHKIIQQKRKRDTLLSDLSSCTSCLLILGLPLPTVGGYGNKLAPEFPNILVKTISPKTPIVGLTKLVITAPPR
jgi:hypothetical protein